MLPSGLSKVVADMLHTGTQPAVFDLDQTLVDGHTLEDLLKILKEAKWVTV